jgi:hypothetical protein
VGVADCPLGRPLPWQSLCPSLKEHRNKPSLSINSRGRFSIFDKYRAYYTRNLLFSIYFFRHLPLPQAKPLVIRRPGLLCPSLCQQAQRAIILPPQLADAPQLIRDDLIICGVLCVLISNLQLNSSPPTPRCSKWPVPGRQTPRNTVIC